MNFKIAIDGPASAGKSTIAKILAKELGFVYIDTGAMYRAIAYFLLKNNIDFNNENDVNKVLNDINVDLKYEKDVLNIYLNNENITNKIRTQEVSNAASISSAYKNVRLKLQELQRSLADRSSCIMDGRDIASRVLPDANVKIYLTASVDVRAKRRYLEDKEKGIESTIEKTKEELIERDYRDSHRENDPLVKVKDAIEIDTSDMTLDEEVDKLLEIIDGKRS